MDDFENWTSVELNFNNGMDSWIIFKDILRPWLDNNVGPIQQYWRLENVGMQPGDVSHFEIKIKEAKYATMLKMRFAGAN